MKKEYLRDTKTDEIILTMYPMENDELFSLLKGFVEHLGCPIKTHINTYGIDKTRGEIENYIASLHYDIVDNPIPDLTAEEVEEGFKQNVSWVVEAWYEDIGRERYKFL